MSGSGTYVPPAYVPPAGGRSSSSGGGASTVRGLRAAGSSSGGGAAAAGRGLRAAGSSGGGAEASASDSAAKLFKTKDNPYLTKFNSSASLSTGHNISSGKQLIEDFDNKIKLVYDDFSGKYADLTAIIEMFIQDLKEGKKTIKGLSEEEKKEIQKRINLQEEGLARIKVGFSPVKVQQNGLKILGKRKSRKSRARKTRKTKH